MRAAVAETNQRVRALHHLAAAIEIVGRIVGEGRKNEALTLTRDEKVLDQLARMPSLACRPGAERALPGRFIVGRIAQHEHAVEIREARGHL